MGSNIINNLRQDKSLRIGWGYLLIISIIGATLNYYTLELEKLGSIVIVASVILWMALYIPAIVMLSKKQWKLTDFGFKLNIRAIAVSLIFIIIFQLSKTNPIESGSILDSLREGFARTGEEIFFRGFAYLLVLKLFSHKKNPAVWAVLLSSVIFTVIHTQPGREVAGLSLLLTVVVVLAIPRWFSDSILPCVVFHTFGNLNLVASFIGISITMLFIIIAHLQGEKSIDLKIKRETVTNKDI